MNTQMEVRLRVPVPRSDEEKQIWNLKLCSSAILLSHSYFYLEEAIAEVR